MDRQDLALGSGANVDQVVAPGAGRAYQQVDEPLGRLVAVIGGTRDSSEYGPQWMNMPKRAS